MISTNPITISETYIYKAMDKKEGYEILLKKLEQCSKKTKREFKQNGQALSLLRESSVEGLVTTDYLFFEQNAWKGEGNSRHSFWMGNSMRFLLTSEGWVFANDLASPDLKEKKKKMQKVTVETAGQYIDQLDHIIAETILKHHEGKVKLDINNRIRPESTMQSINKIFSGYCIDTNELKLTMCKQKVFACDLIEESRHKTSSQDENITLKRKRENDEVSEQIFEQEVHKKIKKVNFTIVVHDVDDEKIK